MKVVATIYTDFSEKFGIPRQGALAHESEGIIVFEPEYRMEEALRGIEKYSHLWLLWQFSETTESSSSDKSLSYMTASHFCSRRSPFTVINSGFPGPAPIK